MRRAALSFALAATAAACATPDIRLALRFRAGEVRTYRLATIADTRIGVEERTTLDRIEITATARVEVLEVGPDSTSLRVTVTPQRLERSGRSGAPPPPQQADVILSPEGAVRAVTAVGGLPPALSDVSVADVAPLLGLALPRGRVHIGDRWTRRLPGPDTVQRGRVAALRVERGFDAAIVALETRRPLARSRTFEGLTLGLRGTEVSSTEVAFAFREGLPVRITSDGRARLRVEGGPARGTLVTITTRTELALLSRGGA